MKKKVSALISMMLGVVTIFASCRGAADDNSSSVPESKTYVINNNSSSYQLLLPQDANETLEFAASEQIDNIRNATGVNLSVVEDKDNLSEGQYISLGNTSLLRNAEIQISYDEIGAQGYYIKTIDDDIILASTTDDGVLYAAYGLLEKYFDYRYYCEDTIRLTQRKTVELLDLDIMDVPDVAYRSSGTNETVNSLNNRRRLRVGTLYDGWEGMVAHTYFLILNPDIYREDNPEWYSPDGENLCLTNLDRDVFTENLKSIIEERPNAQYISIGQQDNFSFCDCNDCNNKIADWQNKGAAEGAAISSLMMEFSNDIATRIDAWIKAEHPERKELRLVTFAYNSTKSAPCIEDKETGEWKLLDPSLKAVDNLSVMMVPYNAIMNYDFSHELNQSVMRQFKSWGAATDSLFDWMYDFNFDNSIQPFFASFGALSGDFKILKEFNTEWVYIERGATSDNKRGINFEIMKDFVSANLLWDTSLNPEDLIDEFMIAYYKEAAEPLKKYIELMSIKQAEFAADGYYLYTFDKNFNTSKFWSFGFLQETCMGLFDEAYAAIEIYKNYDYETYEVLRERIMLETFYVRYLLITIYPYEYENVESMREELIMDMRKVGVGNNNANG